MLLVFSFSFKYFRIEIGDVPTIIISYIILFEFMVKFLDLKSQYLSIKKEIDESIFKVIDSGKFIGDKFVDNFENEFAKYCESKFCVGVANCTDALEIAIESFNFEKGSEIIVPSNSFISSAEAITRSGHKVVFADIKTSDYGICTDSISKLITNKTAAIIVVHLYGIPVDFDKIYNLAKKFKIKIIEDCAQAHGSIYKNKKVGALGDIGVFSFYPGKTLGAFGDGGAIVTNNFDLYLKCKMIKNHGRIDKYNHLFEGRNSRLDSIQAAILSVKLKHLQKWIDRRKFIANTYLSNLKNIDKIVLPKISNAKNCSFHLFVIRTNYRDELKLFLESHSIETGIHYPIALNKLKAYDYLKQDCTDFKSNQIDSKLLSLPIGEHMSDNDINYVIDKIKTYFNDFK